MGVQSRKQRERQARVQSILRAGLQSFAQLGYHGTSMDTIAEMAELGKATLYYYFRSKDELLLAILENGIHQFFNNLAEVWKNLDNPLEKILKISFVAAQFFSDNPDYFQLYHYLNAHPALRRKAMKALHPLIVEKVNLITHVFQQAHQQGVFKNLPLPMVVELFGSLVMGLGIFTHPGQTPERLHQKAKLINEIFLHGVLKSKTGE